MGYWGVIDTTLARGPFKSLDVDFWVLANSTLTLQETITGAGIFYYAFIVVSAAANSDHVSVYLYVDGDIIHPAHNFSEFDTYGFTPQSEPVSLQKYNVDGMCTVLYHFPSGIKFEEKFEIKSHQFSTGTNSWVDVWLGYEEANI